MPGDQDMYNAVPWMYKSINIGAGAAAADFDGRIYIADDNWELIEVREVHQVAGTDGGAVTLMVKKVPTATAKASGTDMLAAGLNMKSTADTPQTGTITTTQANARLVAGDSVGVVLTGTGTSLDGVYVQCKFRRY